MSKLDLNKPMKKQERMMLVVLALVLALIILISKFVIGINFSVMEHGSYISIGYHEVHGAQIWALEFESLTGSISSEGTLPNGAVRSLTVYSGAENADLTLTVECGNERDEYLLQVETLTTVIPGDSDSFTLTLSGTDALSGYFNAVWE